MTATKNYRILVVDDLASMRMLPIHVLRDMGLPNCDQAGDGDTALKLILDRAYDLIITDWNMPGLSGLDLLKAVRGEERTAKTPVLIITGEGSRERVMDALASGVSDFLLKPYTTDALEEKIRKLLKLPVN